MRTGHHYANGRASYCCDWCGLVQPWGDSWLWYGSWLNEDKALTYCCAEHAMHHAGSRRKGRPPKLDASNDLRGES